jgi:microcystin-dependent protein
MAQPFVGQLISVGFSFAPQGYALCDGRVLAIAQYETLFQLIGTTYGGDGQTTFQLPDLRGRVPVGMGTSAFGTNYLIGEVAGAETVTITTNQMAAHSHPMQVNSAGATNPNAGGNTLAVSPTDVYHTGAPAPTAMSAAMVGATGGSQPHSNLQPFLVINWAIALFGVFPSQN